MGVFRLDQVCIFTDQIPRGASRLTDGVSTVENSFKAYIVI